MEQKMRIDLHPQRIQLRFGELCLQQRRLFFALPVAKKVRARVAGREHGDVEDELIDEAEARDLREGRGGDADAE